MRNVIRAVRVALAATMFVSLLAIPSIVLAAEGNITDPDPTLSLVLTAGGATAGAALITGLVQLLKTLLSGLPARLTAFVLSAILVVVAMIDAVGSGSVTLSFASGFVAFLAWYNIARLAMAVYADVTQEPNSLTGPSSSG